MKCKYCGHDHDTAVKCLKNFEKLQVEKAMQSQRLAKTAGPCAVAWRMRGEGNWILTDDGALVTEMKALGWEVQALGVL